MNITAWQQHSNKLLPGPITTTTQIISFQKYSVSNDSTDVGIQQKNILGVFSDVQNRWKVFFKHMMIATTSSNI